MNLADGIEHRGAKCFIGRIALKGHGKLSACFLIQTPRHLMHGSVLIDQGYRLNLSLSHGCGHGTADTTGTPSHHTNTFRQIHPFLPLNPSQCQNSIDYAG
jgi:hypothetical protein